MLKETAYIAAWVLILSCVMQAIFLIIGKWDYTVLLGNILSGSAVVLNFFLMGITIQKAVDMEEKDAAKAMKASQSLRMFLIFIVAVVGILAPCFSIWTTLIPFFFPRIAVALRSFFYKKSEK